MTDPAILTDIEGTTSSISFVKRRAVPVRPAQALPGFVAAHRDDPGVRRWLDVVATEHGACATTR
jgi:enolase-phosphatase E1